MQLEKVYEPQRFEPRWAEWWRASDFFAATPDSQDTRPVFSLVIPPPNVTGSLHMGHMLEHSEIDVTTRWHRMRGYNTLWLPGTDHAGIATQMVVERELAKEGVSRHDLGREGFEAKVWEYKELHGGAILKQMARIGDSVDWSRLRFTLDEGLSHAVRTVFVNLYKKGLIYRGPYMVNWDPKLQTALSDLEVVHEKVEGKLWHFRYPVPGRDVFVVVATTRPETMLGDTAVAINPGDARYTHLHGKTVTLPLMGREIPIILDEMADPEFGTGCVKITPAHDPNDFEAAQRHHLPLIRVIDEHARITSEGGVYAGLDRFEARERVLGDLEAQGFLAGVEPHELSVGKSQRTGVIVEPTVSTQWFVRTKPLAEKVIEATEAGRTVITPDNWQKIFFDWMYNIRDWCISRQLWWGHRIPAWHCRDCQGITVGMEDPTTCEHCGSGNLNQDTDVLDTWFSSALWPFSTLGWPEKTPELAKFYPNTLLITGFDILFFWVARMMMMGMECMGDVPFRTVYIHGLVRDAERQKMSKTKGNTVDPLETIDKYGTDATRITLLLGAAPGTDIVLTEERLTSSRAFANKIWNAARFLFLNMERCEVEPWMPEERPFYTPHSDPASGEAPLEDRWIFSRLNHCAGAVNRAIESYRYHEAAQHLWAFVWGDFCDWYLELKKLRFEEGSGLNHHWRNILTVFECALRLLHPAMPFITEELWQRLRQEGTTRGASICLARFPEADASVEDAAAEAEVEALQAIIGAVRNLRADLGQDPKKTIEARIYTRGIARTAATGQLEALNKLASIEAEVIGGDAPRLKGAVRSSPLFDVVLLVSAAELEAQRKRVEKDQQQLAKLIANTERQLTNEEVTAKMPGHIVEGMRAKLAEYRAKHEKNGEALAALSM
ncbi:MAG: valine--tRNA ligase [Bryobacterales bacterium]|nr:valine--tRNA ligase [Bryobacterales bacterium]